MSRRSFCACRPLVKVVAVEEVAAAEALRRPNARSLHRNPGFVLRLEVEAAHFLRRRIHSDHFEPDLQCLLRYVYHGRRLDDDRFLQERLLSRLAQVLRDASDRVRRRPVCAFRISSGLQFIRAPALQLVQPARKGSRHLLPGQ